MAEDERDKDLRQRFPAPPRGGDVPAPPKVEVKLPPPAGKPQPGTVTPGKYQKLAVAATAATSFAAPIVILSVGGWWLDQRLHNSTAIFAFLGTVVGFAVGILALLRVIQQLNR